MRHAGEDPTFGAQTLSYATAAGNGLLERRSKDSGMAAQDGTSRQIGPPVGSPFEPG